MKKYILISALTVALGSCTSSIEQDLTSEQENAERQMTFKAFIGDEATPGTRTVVNSSNQILWEEDDAISIFDVKKSNKSYQESKNMKMELTDGSNTTEGTFEGACIYSTVGYIAMYPYSEESNFLTASNWLSYHWDMREQIACRGSFPKQTAMVAHCNNSIYDGLFFNFKHVYSFIKFTTTQSFRSIKLEAKDKNTALSSSGLKLVFGLDSETPEILTPVPNPSPSVFMSNRDKSITLRAGTYYMAVLPCVMKGGFDLTIDLADGDALFVRSTTKDVTLERAVVLNLGKFELRNALNPNPTSTEQVDRNEIVFNW